MKNSLLCEILVEYMPKQAIEQYIDYVKNRLNALMQSYDIKAENLNIYFTKCRIVISCEALKLNIGEKSKLVIGPPIKQAYNSDGSPTNSLLGFLKKWNKQVSDVIKPIIKEEKEYTGVKVDEKTFLRNVFIDNLPKILETAKLPKNMRWNEKSTVFSRPVRNFVALFSEEILPVTVFGLSAVNTTFNNLINNYSLKIKKPTFNFYKNLMKKNGIYIQQDERRAIIMNELKKIEKDFRYKDDDLFLIEQWVYECENPVIDIIEFDSQYLQLPFVFLEHILKNKLYLLPLYDVNNKIVNKCIFCVNKLEQLENVREGLKDVISARLEDLKFYWQNDSATDSVRLKERLQSVVLPRSIGNMKNKLQRLASLYTIFSEFLRDEYLIPSATINEILGYFKLDCVTQTFAEYPELEGYIIYELLKSKSATQESNQFFDTILESYKPRSGSDTLPQIKEALYISFLDKLDDVIIFLINGFKPKPQEDPFFIKKKTFLLLYILHSSFLNTIPIRDLLKKVVDFYGTFYKEKFHSEEIKPYSKEFIKVVENIGEWYEQLWQYFIERYRNFLVEKGYKESIVNIVLQTKWDCLKDVKCSIEAIDMMEGLPFWQPLFEVINRTKRIISKEAKNYEFKEELLQQDEEKLLYKVHREFYEKWKDKKLENTHERLEFARKFTENYAEVLHNFFEKVFVEVEDKELQLNRKNLLYQINKFFIDRIADISLLQPKSS